MKKSIPSTSSRLASLDALRGFDLFVLVALGPLVLHYLDASGNTSLSWLREIFTHKDWEGFSPWDLIMPLFVFMSGVSIPFALARMKREGKYLPFFMRLFRRVLLLWLLGMVVQGNLLGLDATRVYLYSNTLQSIAAGYLIASLFYMFSGWRVQIISAVLLLLAYWGAMEFITVDGYGGGNYTPTGNLAEWIDRTVLGRYRDAATVDAAGQVHFAPWYHYTWILSSLTFGVTALSGMLAGRIAREARLPRLTLYLVLGTAFVLLGWLWSNYLPIIKPLWTSSMVLFSSGLCFLLMGLFYYVYDVLHWHIFLDFLKVYGMNSITAYLLSEVVNFRGVAHSVLYGLQHHFPTYYPFILTCAQVLIIFLILRAMHRKGIYLKV